jgi:hypothetical protein
LFAPPTSSLVVHHADLVAPLPLVRQSVAEACTSTTFSTSSSPSSYLLTPYCQKKEKAKAKCGRAGPREYKYSGEKEKLAVEKADIHITSISTFTTSTTITSSNADITPTTANENAITTIATSTIATTTTTLATSTTSTTTPLLPSSLLVAPERATTTLLPASLLVAHERATTTLLPTTLSRPQREERGELGFSL